MKKYSNFECNDLTANFASTDLTADTHSNATGESVSKLTEQLNKAIADLNKQIEIRDTNVAIWKGCDGTQAWCREARDKANAARDRIVGLEKTIENLKDALETAGKNDPQAIIARGNATAALKKAESSGSSAKIIALSIGGAVLVLVGLWAYFKFKKK